MDHAGLRIKENKEVYEGEVIELTPEETENQMGGYGKVISHVIIGLKSVKCTKQLKLDPSIFDSLQKEKVQVKPDTLPMQQCFRIARHDSMSVTTENMVLAPTACVWLSR